MEVDASVLVAVERVNHVSKFSVNTEVEILLLREKKLRYIFLAGVSLNLKCVTISSVNYC